MNKKIIIKKELSSLSLDAIINYILNTPKIIITDTKEKEIKKIIIY